MMFDDWSWTSNWYPGSAGSDVGFGQDRDEEGGSGGSGVGSGGEGDRKDGLDVSGGEGSGGVLSVP
jgi:hypothetical protein